MPILSDGLITMRAPGVQDIDALVAACQDPEITRWTNVPSPYGRAEAQHFLERGQDPTIRQFLAFADDELVGAFSVMELNLEARYAEIGYWVAAPARGRGLAMRALTLLRDWAAGELGVERIELLIHVENERSRRLAERTGFLETGERRPAPRQAEPGPLDYTVFAWSAD